MTAPSVAIIGTRGYPSYYGGFETMVRRLAPYLVDKGWDVAVYGRASAIKDSDIECDPRVESIITRGVDTQSLSTLSFGLTAALHSSKRKPDVALVMNVANGFWLPILRARGVPTVVNVDGIEWEREKWGKNAKRMFKLGAKLTAINATELITDSREIEKTWEKNYSRSSVFIPYGGDLVNGVGPADGLQSRGYILMVARLVPENTIEAFLDAAEVLSERWKVVIVGASGYGGPMDSRVEALASANENIEWYGHLKDDELLFALWHHAGAYFHGHSVGGTNPALVQAMACGAPVVARNTKYNREVLGPHGKFTEPDAGSITAAISEVMESAAEMDRYATELQNRAVEHYSWEGVCAKYVETLDACLSSRSVARA